MISNKDLVGYENSGDFRGVVLENVLKMFSENSMNELVRMHIARADALEIDKIKLNKNFLVNSYKKSRAMKLRGKLNKIAISSTTDLECNQIISILIKGKEKDLKKFVPVWKNVIKPLYLFLDKEVLLYAKLKKLKFKKIKEDIGEIGEFIEELEKKHPEIKRAVVKGLLDKEY